jgi:hypothetical protein
MLKFESYDPILVRCPGCNRLFQTNEPMVSEFAHEVAKMVLELPEDADGRASCARGFCKQAPINAAQSGQNCIILNLVKD